MILTNVICIHHTGWSESVHAVYFRHIQDVSYATGGTAITTDSSITDAFGPFIPLSIVSGNRNANPKTQVIHDKQSLQLLHGVYDYFTSTDKGRKPYTTFMQILWLLHETSWLFHEWQWKWVMHHTECVNLSRSYINKQSVALSPPNLKRLQYLLLWFGRVVRVVLWASG